MTKPAEMYECTNDYLMDDEVRSFTAGRLYPIQPYTDTLYHTINDHGTVHFLYNDDIEEHFKVDIVGDYGKKSINDLLTTNAITPSVDMYYRATPDFVVMFRGVPVKSISIHDNECTIDIAYHAAFTIELHAQAFDLYKKV